MLIEDEIDHMHEISRTYSHPKEIDVEMSEIKDGIYRISGFVGILELLSTNF